MGSPPRPPQIWPPLLDEAGCERVMRSLAPAIGCPQRGHLMMTRQNTLATWGSRSAQIARRPPSFSIYPCNNSLVEMKSNFNLHAAIDRFAAGAHGRPHLPILYL